MHDDAARLGGRSTCELLARATGRLKDIQNANEVKRDSAHTAAKGDTAKIKSQAEKYMDGAKAGKVYADEDSGIDPALRKAQARSVRSGGW